MAGFETLNPNRSNPMRYACMHKVTPSSEAFTPPSKELIQGMGNLIGETAKAGRLLGGGGLLPSDQRLRFTFAGGRWQTEQGPFPGRNELPTGLATIKVDTLDQGIAWCQRYAAAIGAVEVELGPLTEPWHLGICEKPEGHVPLQLMILPLATAATEQGKAPTPQQQQALAALHAEMVKQGVLTFATELQPSRTAMRLHYRGGRRTITDGPFTESKELIGGFCLVEMPGREEMLAWAHRYATILAEDLEIDLRPAVEPRA